VRTVPRELLDASSGALARPLPIKTVATPAKRLR
jgi:hypothetical protein